MSYEKLLNEIYAVISLKYLWPDYQPFFVKSESPDWVNPNMNFGLEVSQALLPDDGQSERFVEKYLGKCKEELPESAFSRYGERLHFYNNRLWAVLPEQTVEQDYCYKACFRFDRKLEKLNANYQGFEQNGLYLFVHPEPGSQVDTDKLFAYMKNSQAGKENQFDLVFLNCSSEIFIFQLTKDYKEKILLPKNAEIFLDLEAERLRHICPWKNGTILDEQ